MITPNEKLEAARMHRRWSIAVASEKAGVSINTFNRWERGLQVPQLGTLDQVCKAFGLSPEDLGFGHAITAKRRKKSNKSGQSIIRATCLSSQLPQSAMVPATAEVEPPLPCVTTLTTQLQLTHELDACIGQARRSIVHMSQEHYEKGGSDGVSRRQAIATLISTPAAVFGVAQNKSKTLLHPEEVLSLCAVNVPLSWQLYFEGGLAEVEAILPGYLSQLVKLTSQSSHNQKKAASLASQGYQLASLLALQHQNFGLAYSYANQAFDYGQLAEDCNLQTASLIRQAQVHFYLKRPSPRLQAYEQALHYSQNTSPLLQGRVYIGLTEVHSELGHAQDANYYLDLARRVFPDQYMSDPNFPYTHFNYWSISSFEGLMYLNLNQPKQAYGSFSQIDKAIPMGLVPNRIELTVRQAEAVCALGDRDQSCAYVAAAVTSARAAGNQLRYDEAYRVYENMRAKWGKEPKIKALGEVFIQ